MSKTPLVSVVLPTFNRKEQLLRAVRSVIGQNYENWQLLIIDDGSTDQSKEKVQQFLADRRISYYYQKNSGASTARNLGITLAQGDFLTFLDSDDEFAPTKLTDQINALTSTSCRFAMTNSTTFFGSDRKSTHLPEQVPQLVLSKSSFIVKKNRAQAFYGAHISIMLPSAVAKKTLFDPTLPSSNDFDFVLRAIRNEKFIYLAKPLYWVHKHLDENRLSSNAQFKIPGLRGLLKKIRNGSYQLSDQESKILTVGILKKIGLFELLNNNFAAGRKYLKEAADLEKKRISKYRLLYLLSFNKLTLKVALAIARYAWRTGVVKL